MDMVILNIDQVSKQWDYIREGILNSIYPIVVPTLENLRSILSQLLMSDMQCWCILNEDRECYGYVITSLNRDINTKEKTLVIYSVYLNKMLPDSETWRKFDSILNEYAKRTECVRIVQYSANPNAISIAKKLGFTEYSFLVKEVS